jgi:nucleotide-binding universal stress UspA family protein
MIRTILAAVDSSPIAESVVATGKDLATRFGARLHLFRAVRIPSEFPAAAHSLPDGLVEMLTHQAIEDLVQLAGGDRKIVCEPPTVDFAKPWRAILDAAARIDADLIVIGSHGFGGWDRILGTTAAGVVNRSDRHVWVVHDRRKGGSTVG